MGLIGLPRQLSQGQEGFWINPPATGQSAALSEAPAEAALPSPPSLVQLTACLTTECVRGILLSGPPFPAAGGQPPRGTAAALRAWAHVCRGFTPRLRPLRDRVVILNGRGICLTQPFWKLCLPLKPWTVPAFKTKTRPSAPTTLQWAFLAHLFAVTGNVPERLSVLATLWALGTQGSETQRLPSRSSHNTLDVAMNPKTE